MRDRVQGSWREIAAYPVIAAAGLVGAVRVLVVGRCDRGPSLADAMGFARRARERRERRAAAVRPATTARRSLLGGPVSEFPDALFPVRVGVFSRAGAQLALLGGHEIKVTLAACKEQHGQLGVYSCYSCDGGNAPSTTQ